MIEMSKLFLGKVLTTMGSPFMLSINSAYSGLSSKYPFRFLLSSVAALITLPLAPLAAYGYDLTRQCELEEFEKKTQHLPRVQLPNYNYSLEEPSYVSISGPDENGTWWIEPFYYLTDNKIGEYPSEEEARKFLIQKGYMEVVATDYPGITYTHWIKNEL